MNYIFDQPINVLLNWSLHFLTKKSADAFLNIPDKKQTHEKKPKKQTNKKTTTTAKKTKKKKKKTTKKHM